VVVLLLTACGVSEDDIGLEFANAACDYTFNCPGNGYYEHRSECIDQLVDEMSAESNEGCDYDGRLAEECLDLIREATGPCDEAAVFEAVHDTCARVWSNC